MTSSAIEPIRVLIVEDNFVVADTLRDLIEDYGGFAATVVPTLERAFAVLPRLRGRMLTGSNLVNRRLRAAGRLGPKPQPRVRQAFSPMVILRLPAPSIVPSSTSPGCTGPTPAGVPVMITSPGRR